MLGIYYFSGTGNTKAVASMLRDELACEIYSIEESYHIHQKLIIMAPIHGFGVPKNVIEFAENLPDDTSKVYIVLTGADYIKVNRSSSKELIHILESKGYNVVYDRIVVMPANFGVDYPAGISRILVETAIKKVQYIAEDIQNNIIRRHEHNGLIDKVFSKIHFGESKYGTKFFSEGLSINENCTKCMICQRNCPVGNIDYSLKFDDTCIMCMRCVYNCPVNAIYSKSIPFAIIKDGYNLEEKLSKEAEDNPYRGYYKHFKKYVEKREL